MANSDKNIRITANRDTTALPKIIFTGQSNNPIALNVLDDNTISFEGSAGQLFSINNNLSSGYIFSINDISGIPSFRVNADGTVGIAEFLGNVGIGLTNPAYKLQISGSAGISGTANISGVLTLSSTTGSGSTSTGALVVSGGVGIGGSIFSSTAYASNISGVIFNNGAITSSGALTITNSSVNAFSVRDGSNSSKFNVDTVGGIVSVLSSTASTSTSTGALVVSGGVGIGQSVIIGGRVGIGTVPNLSMLNIQTSSAGTTGLSILASTSQSANLFEWYADGGVGGGYSLSGRIRPSGHVHLGNPNTMTMSTGTSALLSLQGRGSTEGLAIRGFNSAAFEPLFEIQGNPGNQLFGIYGDGGVNAPRINVTNSTGSTSTSSGALIVTGGVGIGNSLFVNGRVDAGNFKAWVENRTLSTTDTCVGIGTFFINHGAHNILISLNVSDAGYSAAKNYTLTSNWNIGGWFIVAPLSSTGSYSNNNFQLEAYQGSGSLTLRARSLGSGGSLKIYVQNVGQNTATFTAYNSATSETAISTYHPYAFVSQENNVFKINSSTVSTSTSTGALVVTGGVGIGQSLFTSSSYASSISGVTFNNGAITNTGTITSTGVMSISNSSTTAFAVRDGSNSSKFNVDTVGGIVSVLSSTASTSTSSGALIVTGGVGIGGTLNTNRIKAISKITFEPGTGTSAVSGWTGFGMTSVNKLIFGGSRFVGVGGSFACYSDDGVNFSYTTIPGSSSSASYVDVAYGNGVFVAVNQEDVAFIAYSYDGAAWGTTSIPRGLIRTVGFGNGKFLAFSEAPGAVYSSTDGRNWSTIGSLGEYGREVYFANGYFLSPRGVSLYYSADGISWKTANTPGSNYIFNITYGKGLYIAADYLSSQYFTSTDLVTWTPRSIPYKVWTGASYVNGVFYLIPNNDYSLYHSLDGINWSTTTFSTPIGGTNKMFTANDRLYFFSGWGSTLWSTEATTGTLMAKPFYNGEIENTRIGAVKPDSATFTHLTALSPVTFTSTTSSTASDNGALVVFGGVGIGGTLSLAGRMNISSSFASTSTTTGALRVTGGVGIGGSLYVASATAISGVTINAGVITGSLTGTATTATYSHQSGYAITSGSSGTANTATYSHQSGYATTSGLATTATYSHQSGYATTSGTATTSTYSHQSGYATTSGTATTATYAFQSGYGITAGLATTATYAHQSGYAITSGSSGSATTANNINVANALSNSAHTLLFSPTAIGSGVAVSSNTTLSYNPSSFVLSTSGLAITATTVSSSTSNGALQVAGGVGISGRLSFNQAAFGTTGIATNPTMAMIGNTGDPIFLSILEDNTISFEGSQGQLFSITPNLSTGYIYSVNDITGIPLLRANANANVTANEYAGNFGIGLSNPGYKLHVVGSVGFTSTTASTSTTTGTLVVSGGVGIGGSLNVNSASNISNVIINNGVITGNLTGTATTSGFATTASYSNQAGYAITAGSATTATYSHQAGYAITAGSATTAFTAVSTTSVSVASAGNSNLAHPILITNNPSSGSAVSSDSTFTFNPSTEILSVSGISVTSLTGSSNTTTGALIVTGGVGIGGSFNVGNKTRFNDEVYINTLSSNALTIGGSGSVTYAWTVGSTLTANRFNLGYDLSLSPVGGNQSVVQSFWGLQLTGNTFVTPGGFTPTSYGTRDAIGVLVPNQQAGRVAFGIIAHASQTADLQIWTSSTASTSSPYLAVKADGQIYSYANIPATSFSSGALVVSGGVGIGGSLFVNGDLTINGTTTTINSVTISVDDKNIELGSVSSPSDVTAEGGGITLKGATDKFINWYSGVGWSSSESWNLVSGNSYKINNASVLTSTTLGTGVTNSSLTSLGTITTGVWAGTLITANYGGVGLTTPFTVGDILYANTSTTWGRLTAGTSGHLLSSTGTGSTPSYVNPDTLTVGSATTASNLRIAVASSNLSHPVLFTPGSSASGSAVSSDSTFSFNSSTEILSVSGVAITSTTSSSGSTTGALTVAGGVGIGGTVNIAGDETVLGRLYYSQSTVGVAGTSTIPSISFIGQDNNPITLSVLTDNTLSFEGSSGQLFSINNNLSSGTIFSVNDISGIPIIRANANGTLSMGEFTGTVGVGLTNPSFKFHVSGSAGFSGTIYATGDVSLVSNTASTSTSNGALTIAGGVGIGGSLYVASATAISGVTINAGVITGSLTGLATTATYSHQSGYGITSGFATTASYAYQSGYATTSGSSGSATTANNINVVSATTNSTHPVLFTPATGTASGAALSTESTFVYNPSTDILSVSGLAITSGTASTSSTTGALTVSGGVGIGGSLFTSSSYASSISGVVFNNGAITNTGTITSTGVMSISNSSTTAFSVKDGSNNTKFNVNTIGGIVSVSSSTASTNTSTGAFTVSGGVGIGGTLYSGSILTAGRLQNQSFSGSAVGATDGRMGNFSLTSGHDRIIYGNGIFLTNSSWGAYNLAYSTDGLNWNSSSLPVNQGYPVNMYGNGYFVLVASGATNVMYSTNGSSWSQTSIGNTASRISGAYGNGKFVVVGNGVTYNYSTNVTTWSTGTLPFANDWLLVYGNGMFVALGYASNDIIYSYDGINWNTGVINSLGRNFKRLSYGNGIFMATTYSTQGTFYSYDGINWYLSAITGGNEEGVAYGNGVYLVNNVNGYKYSTDGLNWSSGFSYGAEYESAYAAYGLNKFVTYGRTLDGPTNTVTIDPEFTGEINNVRIGAITPGSGDFTNLSSTGSANLVGTVNANNLNVLSKINQTPVLGGFAGTTGWTFQNVLTNPVHALTFGNGSFVSIRRNTNTVNVSSDGNRWKASTMPFSGSWLDLAWGKDKFVAVASAGTTGAYSGNGINWTSMNMPATAQGWYAVAYGDDKFVSVGNTSTAAYSSDGITWSGSSIANTNWTGIAYGNGTFVAVAGVGQSGAYSYDGINWNLVNLPSATGGATTKFITYGNGFFVVTNYVSQAIDYSRDGINWFTSFRSSSANIHTDLAYGNGIYSILNYNEASFSYDGVNWLNSNALTGTDWQAVAYGNNRFVATSINTGNVATIDGPSNTLNLYPKFTGDIDNVRIGAKQAAAAEFTNLAAQQPVRFTANTASINTNTGALVVVGGVGIGGSLYVSSATAISGVTINAGVITGSLTGTASTATYSHQSGYAITSGSSGAATTATYSHQSGYATTSGFATTATYSYQSGYGLTSGLATTATYSHQSGYATTSGLATTATYAHQSGYATTSGLATTATYSYQSGYGITAGFATSATSASIANTSYSVNVNAASANASHFLIFSPTATGSGVALSSESALVYNPSTDILSVSGLAVTSGTASTSTTTGALVVTGGVGIGQTLTVGLGISTPVISAPANLLLKPGVDSTTGIQFTRSSAALPVLTIDTLNSRVGIGLTNPEFDFEVNGSISATTKSFVIEHPTKQGMKLRYGSLEGPENGVYVRGELKDNNTIILPDYWSELIDESSITVHLTPIGNKFVYVKEIKKDSIIVGSMFFQKIHCYYSVWAERKDVPKLKVEF